ncbi:hypothetical protein EVAR_3400_1 [Eumeta japonica]|uniref:Uncharacterized protein n=1 Tax=Eumeta variegata TaxID=151549 RepID=A0A4C1SV16_EUMVA|nr:hypothetical protein EVAR_3400_1 [Eumeta japonica]
MSSRPLVRRLPPRRPPVDRLTKPEMANTCDSFPFNFVIYTIAVNTFHIFKNNHLLDTKAKGSGDKRRRAAPIGRRAPPPEVYWRPYLRSAFNRRPLHSAGERFVPEP